MLFCGRVKFQIGFPGHSGNFMRAQPSTGSPDRGQMPPTLWNVILAARDLHSSGRHAALAQLCEIYWHPLYAFVCRQGFTQHQAEDLTQAFFEQLLQRSWLERVDEKKRAIQNVSAVLTLQFP